MEDGGKKYHQTNPEGGGKGGTTRTEGKGFSMEMDNPYLKKVLKKHSNEREVMGYVEARGKGGSHDSRKEQSQPEKGAKGFLQVPIPSQRFKHLQKLGEGRRERGRTSR